MVCNYVFNLNRNQCPRAAEALIFSSRYINIKGSCKVNIIFSELWRVALSNHRIGMCHESWFCSTVNWIMKLNKRGTQLHKMVWDSFFKITKFMSYPPCLNVYLISGQLVNIIHYVSCLPNHDTKVFNALSSS